MMKFVLVFLIVFLSNQLSHGLKNYTNSDLRECLNCLCHARSRCWSRINCAKYSIDYKYWKKANSPMIDNSDNLYSEESYKKCMKNENCIYATLDQYADAIGHMDCNCDGQFDCKDRFAIHLYGEKCVNPNYTITYAKRFNDCAEKVGVKRMVPQEDNCDPEMF